MSLKPQQPREMPEEVGRLGVKLLSPESPYRMVGEQLYVKYRDEDFADLYPAEGQPGLSPVDLAFVTAFQYMEDLADRAAAEAVRLRLDWKYALHLPLDDAGFNYSVLSEYRARLVNHQAEGRVFEKLLGDLQALGLLKRRGRQRTDSLAVLTRVRQLNRLELVVETLRVALQALLAVDPEWTRTTVPPTWEGRYGERCVAERLSDSERTVLQNETGRDGQWLLDRLTAPTTPPGLMHLPEVQVLRTVWEQHYEVRDREVVFRAPGPYDGETRIQSPHDPEARYSQKHDQEWIGDTLRVQVTETDDEGLPHLITDIALTSSVESDQQALGEIQSRQVEREVLPGERFVDQGYVSGDTLADSTQLGEDLVGPAPGDNSPQARLPEGITLSQFTVNWERLLATCPAGQSSKSSYQRADGGVQFKFDKKLCATCPLRAQCCTGQAGRTITFGPNYAALQAARARQQTDDFKQRYRQHRGGVEGCLSGLVRGQGIRVNRYIGRAKNNLRALFVGVAVNLRRAARWLAGIRPQIRRTGLGLAG
jgi:transposase